MAADLREIERETFSLLRKATSREVEIARRCAAAATGKNVAEQPVALPSLPVESPREVAARVAKKLQERKQFPSLADKKEEVAKKASEASAAIAREKERSSLLNLGAINVPRQTKPHTKKIARAPSTTAEVYTQDQELFLVHKKKRKSAWLEPKELRAEWMRSKYRDEIRRENAWREYAAACAAVEGARGPGSSVDDAKRSVIHRHPIHKLVADSSYAEFVRLLDILHATAGKETMESVNRAWKEVCEVLKAPLLDASIEDDSTHLSSLSDQDEAISPEFFKTLDTLIAPPAPQPTLPPPLADWDCLVAGLARRLEPNLDDVKVWIHRRRKRDDDGLWQTWKWRISVYHLATGMTYCTKMNQGAVMELIEETTSPQTICSAEEQAVEGVAAATAAEAAIEAAFYECETTDEAFKTENAPRFAERANEARLRDRAALVEGLMVRGSLSRAAKLMPTALLLLPLLRLDHDDIPLPAKDSMGPHDHHNEEKERTEDRISQGKDDDPSRDNLPMRRLLIETGKPTGRQKAMRHSKDERGFGSATDDHGSTSPSSPHQNLERTLSEGDGGASWEDQADPVGLAPLALRVCELAGEIYDGKVPGAVVVGAPLLRSSRIVGMFERNEAYSSSNSINVTVVAAFEDAIYAKSHLVSDGHSLASPKSHTTMTTTVDNFVLEPSVYSRMDEESSTTKAAFPLLLLTPTIKVPLVLPDEPIRNIPERAEARPFRRVCFFSGQPVWRRLQKSGEMHRHIFGIRESAFRRERCCGPNDPSTTKRFVWSSVQRCVEQLCRRRDEMDFVESLRKRHVCESSRPLIFRSKLSAKNESTYTQVDLIRMTDTACVAEHRAIGMRKKRAEQRRLLSNQLAMIQGNDSDHADLAIAETRRRLAGKRRRLIERSAPRRLGDSIERWMGRVKDSTLLERRGTWERRRGKSAIFFRNVDDLAEAPRFTWDAPACWEELCPCDMPTVEDQVEDVGSNEAAMPIEDEQKPATEEIGQTLDPPESSMTLITERTDEYWSDSDGELGDVTDWRDILESKVLPQDHGDRRLLRRLKVANEEAYRPAPPACVPPLVLSKEEANPPVFGTPTWQNLSWHRGGQYWRRLPKAQLTARFFSQLKEPAVGSASTSFLAPSSRIVGAVGNTSDSKSWGGAEPATYLPSNLVKAIFVADPVDDVGRVLDASERRARREAAVATPLSLAQLLERGSENEKTSAEEHIEKDDFENAIIQGRAKEDRGQLKQRALFAARSSNISDLEACIDTFQVDINTKDDNGNSLLILAAQQNDIRLVKYLLRRGADINTQNYSGNSALHFCFGYSYDDLGEWLISKGANPDFVNQDGLTCYEFNKMENL